jgi:hypothetical protein
MIALLIALPWLVAIVWVCSRGGWSLLLVGADDVGSQADRIAAFGASVTTARQ